MTRILLFENDPEIIKQLKNGIGDLGFAFEFEAFDRLGGLKELIYNASDEYWSSVDCIVLDLAQEHEEIDGEGPYEIVQEISWISNNLRTPIIIHSAFAEIVDLGEDDHGSIFKVKKGRSSISEVEDIIRTLKSSWFLEVFRMGGRLDLEAKIIAEDLGWSAEHVAYALNETFRETFDTENLIENLREIIENDKDTLEQVLQTYLKPSIDLCRSYNDHQ